MSDMLARLMALAAMQSGGADLSDYYTKAETDRHISDEVARIVSDAPEDFDTLRELSDWIATHEESAAAMNSAIQANTAGVAALYAEVATKAPQATTYTRTEVDTALAAKLNTADVDAALSSTSSNPVQNKAVKSALDSKADATDIPTVPITAIQKNGTGITPVSGTVNITVPTTAADISALPDTTKYAAALSLTINSSTFVVTGQLKDQNGDNLGTAQTIDLPLESVVVGGAYDSQTKKVVLTLQNGNAIEFSVADLVSGLQTELSASNKLNPAYINYDSTHRAVSDTEKSTWNGKQSALTTAQLAAANSGITAERLETIDTTLAAKLNTADVDAALSSTSTNPVQNKSVQASVARLVDAGAKNLADMSNPSTVRGTDYTPLTDGGLRLSCSNKSWTQYIVTVDVTSGKNYVFSLKVENVTGDLSSGHVFIRDEGSTNYSEKSVTAAGEYILTFTPATSIVKILLFVNNSSTAKTVSLDAYGMLCTGADYAVSPEFVPYTPTTRELYEMILALQNGG